MVTTSAMDAAVAKAVASAEAASAENAENERLQHVVTVVREEATVLAARVNYLSASERDLQQRVNASGMRRRLQTE